MSDTTARPITTADLVAALEEIEMLTATGSGLDPEATIRVHLLAGIGRATHDPRAWTKAPPETEAEARARVARGVADLLDPATVIEQLGGGNG